MTARDILTFPDMATVLKGAADLLNNVYLPAATPGLVAAALAVIVVGLPALFTLLWLARRYGARADGSLAGRLDALSQRLATTELLLADATGENYQLRQRVEQLTSRQETLATANSRDGLRQAIALSKHGATTRHLIDACGLSQGEAHLIQTLYGRTPGIDQPAELH